MKDMSAYNEGTDSDEPNEIGTDDDRELMIPAELSGGVLLQISLGTLCIPGNPDEDYVRLIDIGIKLTN
jgi:hypothetical protein